MIFEVSDPFESVVNRCKYLYFQIVEKVPPLFGFGVFLELMLGGFGGLFGTLWHFLDEHRGSKKQRQQTESTELRRKYPELGE